MQSVWVQVARWFWHLGINFHQLEIFAISHIGDFPPDKTRKVVMSSRWIEYLETSCNLSPSSSRTHLYYCIIEWTLCSIMKVCHIVVPTKLIFSEPNHSLPVDQIVTTLHPKCHIWGEHSLNSSSSWWLIDWARAGKPKFLLFIRDFVQKAGAMGVHKYK